MYNYSGGHRAEHQWYNTPGGGFALPHRFIKNEVAQPMDMSYQHGELLCRVDLLEVIFWNKSRCL